MLSKLLDQFRQGINSIPKEDIVPLIILGLIPCIIIVGAIMFAILKFRKERKRGKSYGNNGR